MSDVITQAQAAEIIGVPTRKLYTWGPPPLPNYRPRRYSRIICERWLTEERELAWHDARGAGSTSAAAQTTGISGPGLPEPSGGDRLVRQTMRDLRHTYATLAARATGDLVAVQHALGHSDLRTTQRYLSSTLDRTIAAGAAVGALVEGM